MRILFVVPYTPNLIRVRPYNLIRHLTGGGHQVTVLTLTTGPSEEADAQALATHSHQVISRPLPRWRSAWNCLLALPTPDPLQSAYCWQPQLAGDLDRLLSDGRPPYDVVHVEHLRGVRYALHLLGSGRPHPPVVWDSVDCISYLFQQAAAQSRSRFGRWVTRFELRRTERYEGWLLGRLPRVLVTSAADRRALEALLPPGQTPPPVTVLPNGVDLDYFRPADPAQRQPATVVISGKMSYHANVTMTLNFVQTIMPLVWSQRPDTRVEIVGKDPTAEIRALAHNPAITVTGTVPEVRPYLQRATIAVAPITYGVGIQNKVLEAMACATPVVASPQAVAALQAAPDQELLVAADPGAAAQAILALLEEPARRERIGRAGRAYVERLHSWPAIAGQLETVYRQNRAAA